MEKYEERMKVAEQALALKNPVHEAEYGLDESNQLILYDCLFPKIKAHKTVKKNEGIDVKDLKMQIKLQKQLRESDAGNINLL